MAAAMTFVIASSFAFAAVVVPLVPAVFISALVTAAILAIAMSFLVTRNVLAVVPAVLHKEDSLAAGVVFAAVLAPMFSVARRYAQVDWRAIHRSPLDDHRLGKYHLRLGKVADVDPAIEAGLAYADRDSNIGCDYRGGNGGSG